MSILFLLLSFISSSHSSTRVAITVDDLPTAGALPPNTTWVDIAEKMLAALKRHHVPDAYAFINAGKVREGNGAFRVLELWRDAGYLFGNHTYLHEDIEKTSVEEFKSAIRKNEPMLKRLSGKKNWRYFRYPFLREGSSKTKRNAIRKYLVERGYTIAHVTIDFEDWSWNTPFARCKRQGDTRAIEWLENTYLKNANDMLDRAEQLSQALFKRSIHHILLLHIGGFDAEMLEKLLSNYEKKGVEFISLSEALKDPVYEKDPGVVGKRGSEFTYQVLKSRRLSLKDIGMIRYDGYPERQLARVCAPVIASPGHD